MAQWPPWLRPCLRVRSYDMVGEHLYSSNPANHGKNVKLLLLLPDIFRRMRAWRKTMELQEPGNSLEPVPEVVKRQSPKSERRRVRSCTLQNEMRGSAGAAVGILDSANPREIRA